MSRKISFLTSSLIGALGLLQVSASFAGEIFMQNPVTSNPGLDAFNQQIQQNPSPENYNKRAEALRRLGMRKEAMDDIDQSLSKEPNNVAVLTLRGQVYFEDGMLPEAVSSLNEAIKIDPKFQNGYVLRGRSFLRMEDYNKALSDANLALQLDPKSAYALALRGAAYFGLGRYNDAIQDCTDSIAANPNFDKPYYWRGQAQQALKNYDKSVDDFKNAIRLQPDYRPALVALALSYYRMGKTSDALDVLSDAIEYSDVDDLIAVNTYEGKKATDTSSVPDPEYNLGRQIQDDLKQCISIFDDILKSNPGDRDALRERGIANMHLGKYKEAQKDFAAANDGLPTNPSDFSGLGSQDAYNRAVPLYKAGNAALGSSNYAEAAKNYQNALKIYPQYGRCWHNLAIACSYLGDNFSAELCCVHAISYRPSDWKLWQTFGSALYSEYKQDKGDPKKLDAANAALSESLQLKPDSDADKNEIRHLIGMVKTYQRALTPQINFQITTMPIN